MHHVAGLDDGLVPYVTIDPFAENGASDTSMVTPDVAVGVDDIATIDIDDSCKIKDSILATIK